MPLLWVSVAFLLGLAARDFFLWSRLIWIFLGATGFMLSLLDARLSSKLRFWSGLRSLIPVSIGVLLLLFSLGGLCMENANSPVWKTSDLAWYNDRGEYLLTGWISADPDRRSEMTVLQITVIELQESSPKDWQHAVKYVNGRAQVRMSLDQDWHYGDLLQFYARPITPSESRDFSYRDYLAEFQIHSVIYSPTDVAKVGSGYGSALRKILYDFRSKARQRIFEIYPQPESGLLTGILLGLDNDLPESLAQAYRDTGTAHIIAISGFNLAVLAGLFLFVFTRLTGPYLGGAITLLVLAIYTSFVGASASVLRAMVMALVSTGGQLIGRRSEGANALLFTAALMCMVNPLLIKDVSFQLSFMATFGLVIFAQPMQDWLTHQLEKRTSEKTSPWLAHSLGEYFFFTLAAQFATLPVIALRFGRISVSSLLANPLVLPLQPMLLILGAITTLGGMLHPLVGKVLSLVSWPFLHYTNLMVAWLAKIKGGVLEIHPAIAAALLAFFGGFMLIFFLRENLTRFFHSKNFAVLILCLIAIAGSLFSIYMHKPDGRLHLHLLRCGDSGSLFLKTPSGKTWLINPQGDVDELTANLEKSLSLWDFHLDGILLTQKGDGSLLSDLAGDIRIDRVELAPTAYRSESDEPSLLIPDEIEIEKLLPGQSFELDTGLSITLLSEDADNSTLLLTYGELKVLVPNGVDFAEIKSSTPETLASSFALVLDRRDVSYIPPRVWSNLSPLYILWNDRSLSPFENSEGIDEQTDIHLVSDSNSVWLEK